MSDTKRQNYVQFYMKAVADKRASAEAGRPIYKDVEYIHIRFPGDNKRDFHSPAHIKSRLDKHSGRMLDYREQYPEHYKLFKAGQAEQVIGTPLAELPFLTEAKRAELRAINVHTAEQLAAVPDRQIGKMGPGFRALVDHAAEYIARADSSAETSKLAAEVDALRAQIAAMTRATAQAAPAAEDNGEDLGAGADFDTWDADDIRAFLADNGTEPDGRWGKSKLVEVARAVVLEKRNKAA